MALGSGGVGANPHGTALPSRYSSALTNVLSLEFLVDNEILMFEVDSILEWFVDDEILIFEVN
jgi:hypothetical protein